MVSLIPIVLSFFLPSDIHISESNILPMVGYYNSNIFYSINTDTFAYYILCILLVVLLFLLSYFNKVYIYYIYYSYIVDISILNSYYICLYVLPMCCLFFPNIGNSIYSIGSLSYFVRVLLILIIL